MFGRTLVGQHAGGPRTDRTWRRDSLTSIPPVIHKDSWTDVARAPLWWQLPGDPWEPPPPPQAPAPPPPAAAPPAAPVLRSRPRPVLGCHRSEVAATPSPVPARSPLCWQWGYRWPRHWDQIEPRTPIPPAGTYSGPSIVYDIAALLKLRNSPLSQKPPKDLARFPIDIVKGTNGMSSEETSTAAPFGGPTLKRLMAAPLAVFYLPPNQQTVAPFRHLWTRLMEVAKSHTAPLGEPPLNRPMPAPLVVFYLPPNQHIYRALPFRHLGTRQMEVAKSHSPRIVYSTEAILKLRNSKLSPKQPKELTSFPVSNIKGTSLSSSKATTNGPRIVYYRTFLLQLNRYPQKAPKDLESFPSDIIEEINYVFSEDTKEGPSVVYSTEALLKLRNSKLSQEQPTELRSFPVFIIKGTNFSPSKASTNGPRIVYDRAFLLRLNRYPTKAPKDLESFPSDIEEINYVFSEDTKEGQRFLYARAFLLQLNNTSLSQKPPKDLESFSSDIILSQGTNKPAHNFSLTPPCQ